MKQLHWDKLRSRRGTVWEHTDIEQAGVDMSKLSQLFKIASPAATGRPRSKTELEKKASQTVHLVDLKRAHNISIQLSSFRMPYDKIRDSLLQMDEKLTADQLTVLLDAVPTQKEISQIESFVRAKPAEAPNMGDVEKYFLAIAPIPRLQGRIRSLLFRGHYEGNVARVREQLATLDGATQALRGSARFVRVLESVLAVGNHLNSGTHRGAAEGFRIESLLKLLDIKGTDRSTSLLHFVIDSLESKEAGFVKALEAELKPVNKAASLHIDSLKSMVNELTGGLKQVQNEVAHAVAPIDCTSDVSDRFRDVAVSFAAEAEGEVQGFEARLRGTLAGMRSVAQYYGEEVKGGKHPAIFLTVRDFWFSCNKAHADMLRRWKAAARLKEQQAAKVALAKKQQERTAARKLVDAQSPAAAEATERAGASKDAVGGGAKEDAAAEGGVAGTQAQRAQAEGEPVSGSTSPTDRPSISAGSTKSPLMLARSSDVSSAAGDLETGVLMTPSGRTSRTPSRHRASTLEREKSLEKGIGVDALLADIDDTCSDPGDMLRERMGSEAELVAMGAGSLEALAESAIAAAVSGCDSSAENTPASKSVFGGGLAAVSAKKARQIARDDSDSDSY